MKKFNEWWEKEQMDKRGAYGMQWVGEDIWKAALEWALSTRSSNPRNIVSAEFLKKELRGD